MPNVEVRDAEGNLIHTYEIFAAGHGTLTTDEHLFEIARRNVLEDKLATEDEIDRLTFSVAE